MMEAASPICVLFVGSTAPSKEWLREKAKPLIVRRQRVHDALVWLKEHNPLYKDVVIAMDRIADIPEHDIIPIEPQVVPHSDEQDTLTSRYDGGIRSLREESESNNESAQSIIDSVIVTDVAGNASVAQLRDAAMRHFKSGGGYYELPHEKQAESEMYNVDLFPKVYPTLFPYGIGGIEDNARSVPISMKNHAKHLFSMTNRHFQHHYSFLFTVFNILQRRKVLLQTSLRVKRSRMLVWRRNCRV